MHVISRKAIRDFLASHPGSGDAADALDRWYRIALRAEWASFADVKTDFGTADRVGDYTIFDIGGNKYRLVAEIFHGDQVLLVRGIFTHKEYDNIDFAS
jgi:mRNA interferase HigB